MLAVRAPALSAVASAMETELAALPSGGTPADHARASVRALGTGYLRFALQETGLLRTAFGAPVDVEAAPEAKGRASSLNPFELLGAALDLLGAAGVLSRERRSGAEYLAWSALHGMALLIIDGPLRSLPPAQTKALGQRLLDMVEKGL